MLGDIDGSGVNTIAVGYDESPYDGPEPFPGGIRLVKADRCVPHEGMYRELPPGTDRPSSSAGHSRTVTSYAMNLRAVPNPATASTTLRWNPSQRATTIAIVDARGNALRRWTMPPSAGELHVDLAGWPRGAYTITIASGGSTAAQQLLLL